MLRTHWAFVLPIFVATLALLCGCAGKGDRNKAPAAAAGEPPAQRLSGPYVHENLAVYLVHGPSTLSGDYLTLEEALAAGTVKVHETDDVNELSIENSGSTAVFVQSGDIVKGGKQDRTIGTDFSLAPGSGKVQIAAFCVEHGRWRQRGEESAALFSSSMNQLSGKSLKLYANANYAGGGQEQVWEEVAENQGKLRSSLGADVTATTSPSSLQLTLEDTNVRKAVEGYVKALRGAPDRKDDAIGYVAVINGKVNCADVYGSRKLFAKLWPRQLDSLAAEAAAELEPGAQAKSLTTDEVEAVLRAAQDGKRSENKLPQDNLVTTVESADSVMFDSHAPDEDGFIRRNILAK